MFEQSDANPNTYTFTIDDESGKVLTAGARFSRKPVLVKRDSQHLVLHITGSLEYVPREHYTSARFLFLRIESSHTLPDHSRPLTVYECSLIFEINGRPTKQRRNGKVW